MLKKTITYTDYNGNERTEDFYFNLTEAELTEMQLSADGGLDVVMKRLIQEQNATEMIRIFKDIILRAYGEKSDDGKHFRKSKEISESFLSTEAYNELFMNIVASPESAMEFIRGILPAKVREQIANNQDA